MNISLIDMWSVEYLKSTMNQIIVFKSIINTLIDIKTCITVTIRMQFDIAIEDFEYTKWLDPAGVPCYSKNT